MELRTFKIIGAAAIFTAVLALNSCQKEKAVATKVTDGNAVVTEDNIYIAEVYNEVLSVVEAARAGKSFKNEDVLSSCATITIDSVSNPHTVTIDFGTGCVSGDGSFRSGMVQATYNMDAKSEFKTNTGSYIHASLTDYTVDDRKFNGTVNVDNNGPNGRGNLVIPIVTNTTAERISDHTTLSMNANTSYEWLTGNTTKTRDDDQLALSGSISGTTYQGDNFTATILDPLIQNRADGCNDYPVAGQLQYQIGSQSAHTIDYGNGTCDDQATETVDGNTSTITLSE